MRAKKPSDLKVERHGMYKTREYSIWNAMKTRCLNPNGLRYHRYGARGITVCDRWLHSFKNFYEDMGARPSDKYSLNRIDNNGNYEPGNVEWATITEQALNKGQRKSKSGFTGVWCQQKSNTSTISRTKPWAARFKGRSKTYNLGYFHTAEEASQAYFDAKQKFIKGEL